MSKYLTIEAKDFLDYLKNKSRELKEPITDFISDMEWLSLYRYHTEELRSCYKIELEDDGYVVDEDRLTLAIKYAEESAEKDATTNANEICYGLESLNTEELKKATEENVKEYFTNLNLNLEALQILQKEWPTDYVLEYYR